MLFVSRLSEFTQTDGQIYITACPWLNAQKMLLQRKRLRDPLQISDARYASWHLRLLNNCYRKISTPR